MFPSPTADPAAAMTNPRRLEKPVLFACFMIEIILSFLELLRFGTAADLFFEKQCPFHYNRSLEKMQSFLRFVFNLFGFVWMIFGIFC